MEKHLNFSPISSLWWSSSPGISLWSILESQLSHYFSRTLTWYSISSSSTPSFHHRSLEGWKRNLWRKYSLSATLDTFKFVSCFLWACFTSTLRKLNHLICFCNFAVYNFAMIIKETLFVNFWVIFFKIIIFLWRLAGHRSKWANDRSQICVLLS